MSAVSEVKATLLILLPTFYAKRLYLPSFTPLSSLKHRTLTPGYRTHSPSVSLAGACHKPIFVEHLSTHSSQLGPAEGTHPGMSAQQEAPGPSSRRHAAHPQPHPRGLGASRYRPTPHPPHSETSSRCRPPTPARPRDRPRLPPPRGLRRLSAAPRPVPPEGRGRGGKGRPRRPRPRAHRHGVEALLLRGHDEDVVEIHGRGRSRGRRRLSAPLSARPAPRRSLPAAAACPPSVASPRAGVTARASLPP